MKKTVLFFAFIFVLNGLFAQGTKTDQAVAYNNKIIELQNAISSQMLLYIRMLESENPDFKSLYQQVKTIETTTNSSIKQLNKLKTFDGNTEIKECAMNLFSLYNRLAKNEFKEMTSIIEDIYTGKLSTESEITNGLERLQAIEHNIGLIEQPLDEKFSVAQQKFAEKYKLDLHNNMYQDEFDEIGK